MKLTGPTTIPIRPKALPTQNKVVSRNVINYYVFEKNIGWIVINID